jgi:ElaB/YqjD/DUF883 family membrane-anchored ribosome-binding protein
MAEPTATIPPATKPGQDRPAGDDQLTLRAAEAAHDMIDRLARQAADAEVRIRRSAEDLERRAREGGREAREQGEELRGAVSEYVHEHPVSALALAFGAGIVASALLRR